MKTGPPSTAACCHSSTSLKPSKFYCCWFSTSHSSPSATTKRLFSIRYCEALDGVLGGHVNKVISAEQKLLFHHFLSLSMSSGKYQVQACRHRTLMSELASLRNCWTLIYQPHLLYVQFLGDSDTSLFLSLKHPQPSVRLSAVDHLMGIITSGQVR